MSRPNFRRLERSVSVVRIQERILEINVKLVFLGGLHTSILVSRCRAHGSNNGPSASKAQLHRTAQSLQRTKSFI